MATYSKPDHEDHYLDHLVHQRFNFEYRFEHNIRINVGMRNRAFFGDSVEFAQYEDIVSLDNGYWDFNHTISSDSDHILNTQLDRLYLESNQADWTFKVGRFRVNWAMNTIWNPNDIFNAYSIYDVDYEERSGSDALSIEKQLGFADGVELVYSPNEESDLDRYSIRYYANYKGWDYQLIGGRSGFDNVLGAGFVTDWYDASIRGELTWFDPYTRYNESVETHRTLVSSFEVDYHLGGKSNWVARASWLYIQDPIEQAREVLYLKLPVDAKTLSFTENTGYADISFDLTPLSRFTLAASYYQDDSYFIGLSNHYSLDNDWQLLMFVQRFDGSSRSVLGASATTLVYGSIKWSF